MVHDFRLTYQKGDALYGVVHVPPENTIIAVEDPFAEIQAELDYSPNKYEHVCLFGDWNSRIKNHQQNVEPYFDILHEKDVDDLYDELERDSHLFIGTNVVHKRFNEDTSLKNYGNKLVDFLIFNNMCIF